ncbi:MAG: type I restriction enzyme HsdR N-terminal domain-containing protein [Bacteroidetes bacterium]|nr:type I restriction enzyme HsdR N-terminal domain-containing protein [Bacteroidota bacterium]
MFALFTMPACPFKTKKEGDQLQVLDLIRKTYVAFTPEEMVRQRVLYFLIKRKQFMPGLIEVEKQIELFNTTKRVDILARDKNMQPLLLVECKAPSVNLSQKEANQLARYQLSLKAPYSMLTNGMFHLVVKNEGNKIRFLENLPDFNEIK